MLNFERLWSNAGHFSLALAKSAKTTTWIWDLHADAHDFDFPINLHQASSHRLTLAANLAHLSVVLLWLAGMHFHGAYLSNVTAWQSDPTHCAFLLQASFGQLSVKMFLTQMSVVTFKVNTLLLDCSTYGGHKA